VNTLHEILVEVPAVETVVGQPRITPIRDHVPTSRARATSVYDGQIQALIQQLFFRRDSQPVRHVGFVPVDASTDTAKLCLQVATALADEDRYDIGLFDADPDSLPLQTQLQIPVPTRADVAWTLGPHLWMVPRQSWLPDESGQRVTAQTLSRLGELTNEFDFSILCCAPASWLAASIGQTCDGVVLVLTANKTRRIVASQVSDQLNQARVPLLGTVLADRRFPVPQGLYRSL